MGFARMSDSERLIDAYVAAAGKTALQRVRAISNLREAARLAGSVPDRLSRYLDKLEAEAIADKRPGALTDRQDEGSED